MMLIIVAQPPNYKPVSNHQSFNFQLQEGSWGEV